MANVGPSNTRSTTRTSESPAIEAPEVPIPAAFASRSKKRKSSILSLAVTAVVVPGLFATVALPAYAFNPTPDTKAAEAVAQVQQLKEQNAQTVAVDSDAAAVGVARDAFSATTPEELAAERERAALAAAYAAYSGPTTADFLANPPYPNFDLAQVAQVALQYQGVPYVYGGSTPAGFDCSGFVAYVYAQFGISLPHSVSGSAAAGTAIATEAALPGDIVILPGHSGIYLGGGMFIDSATEGTTISVRPIYDSNYYIVRIGI